MFNHYRPACLITSRLSLSLSFGSHSYLMQIEMLREREGEGSQTTALTKVIFKAWMLLLQTDKEIIISLWENYTKGEKCFDGISWSLHVNNRDRTCPWPYEGQGIATMNNAYCCKYEVWRWANWERFVSSNDVEYFWKLEICANLKLVIQSWWDENDDDDWVHRALRGMKQQAKQTATLSFLAAPGWLLWWIELSSTMRL